ncbi:MAG TPA: RHS repeat-associated core domain-containing protein [Thermoanaerobaculaceae bacterium]|nr:RHS repeat-associated core domain-containing protein [Thermoanaerobaculaceae bacterium]
MVGAMGSGVLPDAVADGVRCDGFGRPVIEKTRLPAKSCVGSTCWNQRLTEYNDVDKVSRLTQATIATGSGTSQSQGYTYDAWGNMLTYGGQLRDVSGTTNRLSHASHDARGNQTGWIWVAGDQRYRYRFDWDPLDRMRWHNGPGINRVFAHTADGERIVERDLTSGVTTISLRGLDAKVLREVKLENGSYSWQKDYIYREGQLLASHGHNEPLQHYHLDHLGTPRMLSNRCGERLQRFESFPFGEAIAELPQHPETMRLTGHQRDLNQPTTTEDDLDYMHARYYGTKMGRFLGVDPSSRSIGAERPQSWNRYAYVLGNPTRLLDRTGEAPGDSFKTPEAAAADFHAYVAATRGFSLEWGSHLYRSGERAYSYTEPYSSGTASAWAPFSPVGYSLTELPGELVALAHTHTSDWKAGPIAFSASDIEVAAAFGRTVFVGLPTAGLFQWTPEQSASGVHVAAGAQQEVLVSRFTFGGQQLVEVRMGNQVIRGRLNADGEFETSDGKKFKLADAPSEGRLKP